MNDLTVISLGGSLIVSNSINTDYIKKFCAVLKSRQGRRFIVVVGGGRTARDYVAAAAALGKISDAAKDEIGIAATKLNAALVQSCLSEIAHQQVESVPRKVAFGRVLVASGWRPGFSTDYCAVAWAECNGAGEIINLTNTNYLYDKDPRKSSDAKRIERASWQQLRALVGNRWVPSSNLPFDPIAAAKAEKLGMKAMLLDGRDLGNFERLLDGKDFRGSVIG